MTKKSKQNQFSPLDTLPDKSHWESLIGNMEYKRIPTSDLPSSVRDNGLTAKFNSVILAASGSTASMAYSAIGLRPDKNDKLDEHPFVFYYDNNNDSENFGGIIHHGDWNQRTIDLNPNQITALSASGLTASFTYKDIPPNSSGSLIELNDNGMLQGVSEQFKILIKEKEKNDSSEEL